MKSFVFQINADVDVCVTTTLLKDAIQFLDGHPEFNMEEVSSMWIEKNKEDEDLETIITKYGHIGHARFYREGEVWNEGF